MKKNFPNSFGTSCTICLILLSAVLALALCGCATPTQIEVLTDQKRLDFERSGPHAAWAGSDPERQATVANIESSWQDDINAKARRVGATTHPAE